MIQVNKLVCENVLIIEMHGATIKVKTSTFRALSNRLALEICVD
jgi:hypothetical protein